MNSVDAFKALRIRIWADAASVIYVRDPLPPMTLAEAEAYGMTTQEEVDDYNKSEVEGRDSRADLLAAERRWEAWQYVALCMDWSVPKDPYDVYEQPVEWCQP